MNRVHRQAGFSLVSLLLALAVLGGLYVAVMKVYRNGGLSPQTQKALAEQGVAAPAGYAALIERARGVSDVVTAAAEKQERDVEALPGN
jgi:type II secretory pathway pseudopilin PulG